MAGVALSEARRGKSTRHLLTGLLRQSVYGRLAGYEDVNDAERLCRDPVMRAVVDRKGLDGLAASSSQIGRFETGWLASDDNLAALTDLSGAWIDRVARRFRANFECRLTVSGRGQCARLGQAGQEFS